jgi:hypothetical protein
VIQRALEATHAGREELPLVDAARRGVAAREGRDLRHQRRGVVAGRTRCHLQAEAAIGVARTVRPDG